MALAQAPAAAPAPGDDPVVLTVGNEKITKSQFEQILDSATAQPGQPKPALSPEGRRKIAENLAELKVLAQEARTQKVDQRADIKLQLMLRTDQILAGTVFQEINNNLKLDDAARKAFYEANKAEWDQVTARHILIRFKGSPVPLKTGQKDLTEEEALAKTKDLRAQVASGKAKFEDLAKKESDDTGSGAQGGDLGEFGRGRMVPQFEEAAFAMKSGELSEPVKSQFGFHLIQVQKHEAKKFEEVASEIDEKLKPELAQKAIDQLKGKTTVTFDKDYFGR
jgi:peptidyl-prolyl cis-trans isomerase C